MSLEEMFILIGRICSGAETGWWTWHEHLQRNVFVVLFFGFMSTDLMVGNPACGCRSVLNSASACRFVLDLNLCNDLRFCCVPSNQLDDPNFETNLCVKTPEFVDQVRAMALKVLNSFIYKCRNQV
jgi:hypothetical protein